MKVSERLLKKVSESASVRQLSELFLNKRLVNVKGAAGSLKSVLLAHLFEKVSSQVVYLTSDSIEAEGIKDDVELFVGAGQVAFFPASDMYGFGLDLANDTVKGERLSALQLLCEGQPQIVVAHSSALLHKLPAHSKFQKEKISISVGMSLDFDANIPALINLGFVREPRVERRGEMSVRGGIVDLFPFSSEFPYRIEFLGDEVESIRRFDPSTQRSLKEVKQLLVYPQELASEDSTGTEGNLLDYLSDDAIVILDEPEIIRKKLDPLSGSDDSDLADDSSKNTENGFLNEIFERLARFTQLHFVSLGEKYENLVNLGSRSQESFKGNLKLLKKSLEKSNKDQLREYQTPPEIFFLCENEGHAERLGEIFTDEGIKFPNLSVAPFGLHKGFTFPDANLVVYSEHEFYGRSRRLRLPKKTFQGLTPRKLKQLNVGDYVVHVDYGIGVFRGLKKVVVAGHERECLHLEYKEKDKVYVRVERMDRVKKYAPKEGAQPKLNKLGSLDWQRLKERTKKKIKDIAKELIEIYAKRKAQEGFAFSEDTIWQRELEASFPYEDTPDQITATIDVKKDMESSKPMDRLVCGDVGFGKTEIAVRAAFKTVLNNKQVAMLVPTTILAYQHYNTFRERLENFPVNVEMLSRFRSKAEQKQILEKLKSGEIDIVIGTHRLVSKDVEFKDLGLLIIDEEQRFGVQHKERLKKFRATIDVLTLTATPIPRTLQFALMGARDMTNINTAPRNRLPIITEILSFNKEYIREVILRELDRGGQVFFVHNRVLSIDRVAKMVSDLVPEAHVAVAHGQMRENELEKIMVDFVQYKYDILVSTMIIESGLDMPNVNTIIVNRADKLGLAQLYQLRGRVGRSHQRAYAYLLIPSVDSLTPEALKRLRALEEFTELGSGSQLAMRDLEIRGAGTLLGAEQSGFIDSLGFDLYNKVLDEAVKELKNENLPDEAAVQPEIETRVDMDCDAFLPDDYVESGTERVEIYQRLTESVTVEEFDDIRLELQDRFGKLPEPVDNLLNFLSIRIFGKQLGLKSISIRDSEMNAEFAPEMLNFDGEPFKKWLGSMLENATQPFEFYQNNGFGIRLNLDNINGQKMLIIKEFVGSLIESNS